MRIYPESKDQCARWFKEKRFVSCWHCPTGAANSGEQHASNQRPCIRCGSEYHRLMLGSICVSCWNRTIELARGRNSKGTWPAQLAAVLQSVSAIIETDDASIREALTPRRHARNHDERLSWMGDRRNMIALDLQRLESGVLWVHGYFRDRAELEAMLNRLMGGFFEVVEYDERPIVRPASVS
jgi:hypothetical protein